MGREVRKVPANWVHPRLDNGRYKPLHDASMYESVKRDWEENYAAKGLQETLEWCGNPPDRNDYMPDWSESERTHLMMYETCSEGTPISPAFETSEELAQWLADNNASAFGYQTATYEQWLTTCRGAWAPSMVIENGVLKSGVEFSHDEAKP